MCPRAKLALALYACGAAASAQVADKVYWNGTVLTMNTAGQSVEAVATRGAEILAAGTKEQILEHAQVLQANNHSVFERIERRMNAKVIK